MFATLTCGWTVSVLNRISRYVHQFLAVEIIQGQDGRHQLLVQILVVCSEGARKREQALIHRQVLNIPDNAIMHGLSSSTLNYVLDRFRVPNSPGIAKSCALAKLNNNLLLSLNVNS